MEELLSQKVGTLLCKVKVGESDAVLSVLQKVGQDIGTVTGSVQEHGVTKALDFW